MQPEKLIEKILREKTAISPAGLQSGISGALLSEYALASLFSEQVRQAHSKGEIHIHSLHSPFTPHSNTILPTSFLLDGLSFPQSSSAPAKHFSSALSHTAAFLFQSHKFFSGQQTIPALNWFLSPYLFHDSLSPLEAKQLLQGFVFRLSQGSLPATISLSTSCPKELAQQQAVFAGKRIDETYSEFSKQAEQINSALMQILSAGQPASKPKPKNFLFPHFSANAKEIDWSTSQGKQVIAAAKRSKITFLNSPLPVSQGGTNRIVSVNLPKLAAKAKTESKFFPRLTSSLEKAKLALLESNSILARSLNEWKLLPFLKSKTSEGTPFFDFKKRQLSISLQGLNECSLALSNEPLHLKHGLALAIKISKHAFAAVQGFSKREGIEFTLSRPPLQHFFIPLEQEMDLVGRARAESMLHPFFNSAVSTFPIKESAFSSEEAAEKAKQLSETQLKGFELAFAKG